jgi:hypothetical protein
MTEHEIRLLLAAAMAYDNRNPGQAAVLAWQEAAARARWTFAEAIDAVHAHYAESTAFLMPGHITQRLRARPAAAPPTVSELRGELPPTAPASVETRRQAVSRFAAKFAPPSHRGSAARSARPMRPANRSTADHAAARERARAELAQLTPAPLPEEPS